MGPIKQRARGLVIRAVLCLRRKCRLQLIFRSNLRRYVPWPHARNFQVFCHEQRLAVITDRCRPINFAGQGPTYHFRYLDHLVSGCHSRLLSNRRTINAARRHTNGRPYFARRKFVSASFRFHNTIFRKVSFLPGAFPIVSFPTANVRFAGYLAGAPWLKVIKV